MDLRHFRYFVAVAEELSFTKAARRLHISQPPLSQHIQEMERELGTLLFDRSRGHVQLTQPGALFLEEARKTLQQAENAIETARRAGRGELASLRVGYGAWAPYTQIFPRLVYAYRQRCPTVQLSLTVGGTDSVLQAILKGELDVGIIRPAVDAIFAPELCIEAVYSDHLMLALPQDHPLAASGDAVDLKALADEAFILGASPSGMGAYRQVYKACLEEGFKPRVVQQAKEADTMLGLVGSGLGVTILPEILRSIAMRNVAWRPLRAKASLLSTVYAVHHAEKYKSAQRDHFLDVLHEQIEQGP